MAACTAATGVTDIYRPMVRVRVSGPTGAQRLSALVDTGADFTLFPRSPATLLGITPDDTHPCPMAGLSGSPIMASPAQVDLELASPSQSYRWEGLVGFIEPAPNCLILGHAGCRGICDHHPSFQSSRFYRG